MNHKDTVPKRIYLSRLWHHYIEHSCQFSYDQQHSDDIEYARVDPPAAPTEAEWHPFLQYPLGRFRKPEDDIGKCWFIVNHHYCGLSADAKIHQVLAAPPAPDEADKAVARELIGNVNNYAEDNGELSISAFGPLSQRIATALAQARKQTWEKALEAVKGELHSHPSIEMESLCSHNAAIRSSITTLESAAKVER